MLSDNGREFCGRPDRHPYERFHRTVLDEHFRVEGRKTWFETIDEMQKALDAWLAAYNTKCPHQGRNMNGRTPLQALIDGLPGRPSQPLQKPKGDRLTANPKQASTTQETRAA